jgi:C4-dicarboxylate transporter DctM subunit
MDLVILFGVLFGFLIIGAPIGVCLGIGTLAVMMFTTDMAPVLLAQACFTGLDTFTLLAIPFFCVAGDFMMFGGISKRLLSLCNALVGHLTGGLAHVTTITCMFFAAISGSGPATVSAIGSFMIPEMTEKGYDTSFAAALAACAGAIGVIIPPSIPFIIYAVAVGCSVSDLFLAGVLPGLLIGVLLMAVSYWQARKNGWKRNDGKATGRQVWTELKKSFLALLSPAIILGSIYAGVCSPTEAAVVGIVYAYVVGAFVYRELKWKHIVQSMIDAVLISGSTLFMVGITTCLGRVLTLKAIPQRICDGLGSISSNSIVIMLLITVMLLIVGCFMDNISATIILAPMLLPTAQLCGLSTVQFGVVMTMLLAVGFITPPYGINLFVASQLSKIPLLSTAKRAVPLMLAMLAAALLVMFVPIFTLGL